MKTRFFFTSILLVVCAVIYAADVTPSVNLKNYYADADNKSGDALRSELHAIIAPHTLVSYDNLRHMYQWSDTYDAKGEVIEDIYSECKPEFTTTFNDGTCGFNREHSLPKSWFGVQVGSQMYSDVFHLYPANSNVNSYRNNFAYGECANGVVYNNNGIVGKGRKGSSTFVSDDGISYSSVGTVYEPADEYKGDLARSYFYMVTCYDTVNFTRADGGISMFVYDQENNSADLSQYSIDLLLKWHRNDPVSKKELIRNEVIYGNTEYNHGKYKQGNRNPFIDYPDLAEYIWGSRKGSKISLASLVSAYSDEYQGGTLPEPEKYNIELYRNGEIEEIRDIEGDYDLPTEETDPCEDWIFDGWCLNKVSSTSDQPNYVTTVSGAQTVYAVYKHQTMTEGGESMEDRFDFTEQGYENQTDLTTTPIEMNNCTLTFNVGSGSNVPTYYTTENGSARMYKGSKLTVSAEYDITYISFGGVTKTGVLSASVGTYSDNVKSWSGSAKEVTFTNNEDSNNQFRFQTITVTTAGGSVTTTVYASDADCEIPLIDPTAVFIYSSISLEYGGFVSNEFTTDSHGAITYTSDNTDVATVDETTGAVTIHGVGQAVITATVAKTTTYNEAEASYIITVIKATPVININNEGKATLIVGDEDWFEAQSDFAAVSYESSDTDVATIDEEGHINALSAGTTHIRAFIEATDNNNAAEVGYDLTVEVPTQYTITWMVDGTPNKVIYEDGQSLELPDLDIKPCSSGKVFVGWTSYPNSPDIYFNASSGRGVTADAVYYAVFATEHSSETGEEVFQYEKVTSDPGDWSGTYLLVNDGEAKVFIGSSSTGEVGDVTITDGVIAYSDEMAKNEVIIAPIEGGYSLQMNENATKNALKYLAASTGSNNTISFSAAAQLNTIAISNDSVAIRSNDAILRYNRNGGKPCFRYYKLLSSPNPLMFLYKKTVTTINETYYTDFTTTCDETEKLNNLLELKQAERGEYQVLLEDAIVTYVISNKAYLQDATSGLYLYKSRGTLAVGDVINGVVKIETADYNGLCEATTFDLQSAVVTSDPSLVTPIIVTAAELTDAENYYRWESVYVKVQHVVVTSAFKNKSAKVTQSLTTLDLRDQNFTATITAEVGDQINVSGWIGDYKGTKQLHIWEQSQLENVTTTLLDHSVEEEITTKILQNGVLYIIRNGCVYNVTGQIINK